eukprot:9470037-Pyramimonas_sp.AAC.2
MEGRDRRRREEHGHLARRGGCMIFEGTGTGTELFFRRLYCAGLKTVLGLEARGVRRATVELPSSSSSPSLLPP